MKNICSFYCKYALLILIFAFSSLAHSTAGNQAVINVPMQYLSSDCSQPVQTPVFPMITDNPVLRLRIRTTNSLNPIKLTGLNMNMNGTENIQDILIIRVYSSGSDSTFKTVKRFGPSFTSPATGDISISGNLELSEGENFIWITYSIASKALIDRVVDAECTSITLNDSIQIIPANRAPAGNRKILPKVGLKSLGEDVITTKSPYPGTNVASFAQSVIKTYGGYQYSAYWHETKQLALARKKVTDSNWETLILTDYTSANNLADNHYSISMGLCPKDGTIHLCFDQHNQNLRYRKSIKNLINEPEKFEWSATHFGNIISYLNGTTTVTQVTYPRFITKPDGNLLLEMRRGTSGNGDSYLWEYNGNLGVWISIGKYIDGISSGQNAYIHGIEFDRNGRLHASWCWRETSAPETNHDLYYAYSNDSGRTWRNSAGAQVGTAGSNPLKINTSGIKVWNIPKNRSLMNQESMCVDNNGRPHVLNGFIKDEDPNVAVWGTAYPVHFYRDDQGVWQRNFILIEPKTNRDQIVCDANNNIYIILNNNILMATEQNAWKDWTIVAQKGTGSFIGDGAVDKDRALNDNVLSIVSGRSGNTLSQISFLIDNLHPGKGKGLTKEIFADSLFKNKISSKEANINIDGNTTLPGITKPETGYAVKYNGTIETRIADNYSLYLTTTGKIRCKINGITVLDDQQNSTLKEYKITLTMYASHNYHIEIEGVFMTENPVLKLEWENARHTRSVVPVNALYQGVETMPNTDLMEISYPGKLKIYPNPGSGNVTITGINENNTSAQLRLYGVDGSLIMSETLTGKQQDEINFDFSFLSAGIYFPEIISEQKKYSGKLVIN